MLNSHYSHLEPFLRQIKSHFQTPATLIHDARNQLKVFSQDSVQIVVKSFRIPHLLNRFVYAWVRDSKAKKSYDHAVRLKALGITTPEPIGYIEFYDKGLLKESYFLALRSAYDFTIRSPLLDVHWPDHDEIFKQFGKFTYHLHEKGVLHLDYSPGNILISQTEEGLYRFDLVDINRMRFGRLSDVQKMQNLSKLWADERALTIIAHSYAAEAGLDPEKTAEAMIFYDRQNKKIKTFKRRLKGET